MTKKQKSGKSDGTTALDLYKKLISNEIIPLLEQFPSVKYLPIERVGGGSFSEVYKAIDIFADEYDNSSYRFSVYVPPKEERECDIKHLENIIFTMQELKSSWVDIYIKYHRLLANFDNKVQYVALKTITPTSSPSKIKEELEFLILLRGKFFTSPVITAVRKEDQVIVVMPYFSHDSAMEYIPRMKEIDIKLYMAQLLFALSWLHTMNIIHRDVKPGNFLFSLSTRRGLLVDFGLAEYFDDSFQEEKETKSTIDAEIHRGLRETYGDGILPKDSRSQLKANRGGTRGFRAPEVLMRYKDQTPAIDLWAAGIVLLCLATKRFPFFQSNDDDDALVELAIVFGRKKVEKAAAICNRVWKCNVPGITDEGKFKTLKELCQSLNPYDEWSDDLYDLLDKLLDFDFNSRITSLDALQHKFINSQEVLEKLNKELLNF